MLQYLIVSVYSRTLKPFQPFYLINMSSQNCGSGDATYCLSCHSITLLLIPMLLPSRLSVLISTIFLMIHSCTAARPQCIPWNAPLRSDCEYILAHLPSILPTTNPQPFSDSLQSTSSPFFPQASFHYRSCTIKLEYWYWDRTPGRWAHGVSTSAQAIAHTWHDQKAACNAIVEKCCDDSRSGMLWTGDDEDRDGFQVRVGNRYESVDEMALYQRMALRWNEPSWIPRDGNIFKKMIYEL